jgi:type II secretory pathway component PulK
VVVMTETQIRLVRLMIASMVGMSIYQAFVIRRLTNQLNYGRAQFYRLHNASDYLLEIIQNNDIELTEFDLIALTAISEGK